MANGVRNEVAQLRERPTAKVLIIGGGINGIATFRDLALQGIDVVLVERNDFISGASAASSHMIHGGIRYLENGEFRLVHESVTERNRLLRIAPHYVKPLQTTVPIFSTFSGMMAAPIRFITHKQSSPTERGAALIKTGLTIYDSFSRGGGRVPRHKFLNRKQALAELPDLNPELKYSATYYDASMHDPERLALDVLFDGLAIGSNARAANYLAATGITASGIRLRDEVSGEEFFITADIVVNATGPWVDITNTSFGNNTRYMGGTKGSHIVIDNLDLLNATRGREIFFEHEDGRIVLIYPLKGRVMVGTTDLEHDMRQPIVCTDSEINYFFELVAHVFPDIQVDSSQIVYKFAGVRPLPRHDDTQPGFVSRDYSIEKTDVAGLPDTTLLSLVGGKWTTFRALAEHLTNEILKLIGGVRARATSKLAIGGGAGFPVSKDARRVWVVSHGDEVGQYRADELLTRYGTKAEALIEKLAGEIETPLYSNAEYSREEVQWLVLNERVVYLLDLVQRRTSLAFTGSLNSALLNEIAEIVAECLDWDEDRKNIEIAETRRVLVEQHGMQLEQTDIPQHG